MLLEIGMIFGAYLIGSIPSGLLVSRFLGGMDPRRQGSGNIGATNVLRVVGKRAAILTLLGDFLKGFLPVCIGLLFNVGEPEIFWIGLAAILGHILPLFLKFKGGKGVATSFGVFLPLSPSVALIALVIWIGGVYFSGYSSVGALAAFGALPFLIFFLKPDPYFILFAFTISILVYLRHRGNISRLLHGTEGPIQQS